MFRLPKIVITNVDEDPLVTLRKKELKRQKITEICVVCSLVAINWIMVISKSCLVFGILSGVITTLITVMQYCVLLKTRLVTHFGPQHNLPQDQEESTMADTLRSTLYTVRTLFGHLQGMMKGTKINSLPK